MAGKSAILSVRIIADAAKAAAGFNDAEKQVGNFESKVTSKLGVTTEQIDKVALASTAAAGAYAAFAYDAMQSASELEQATGAVNSVFKEQADEVMNLAENAAQAVGLSASEYANSSAIMASQLGNMGVETENLAGQTDELITLAADLSSMYGGTTAEAISAVSSLLRGERDPIERYAVSIKQADINARLAADGLTGLEGEALKQAETQATLSLLFEQSGDALGNFQRETDTAAGSTQIAAAEWENAKAKLGEQFLPIAVQAAGIIGDIATKMGEHPGLFKAAGAAILTFTGAAVGISSAIKVVNGFSTAFRLVNTVMAANPIGLVVTAVAALAAGLIYAYNESETFRNFVNNLGDTAWAVFQGIGDWIQRFVINNIATAIGWAKDLSSWLQNAFSWGDAVGGQSRSASFAAASPEMTGVLAAAEILRFMPQPPDVTAAYYSAPASAAWPLRTSPIELAPGPTYNITVNGALDPEETARQIQRILEREDKRQSW